mmetsp:Transcript_24101/g.51099  ORF Transcript_24101/g.51099 Transcript_24101/m.51099 type:complete len:150 (+) Transcript_24101:1379-1828(+)
MSLNSFPAGTMLEVMRKFPQLRRKVRLKGMMGGKWEGRKWNGGRVWIGSHPSSTLGWQRCDVRYSWFVVPAEYLAVAIGRSSALEDCWILSLLLCRWKRLLEVSVSSWCVVIRSHSFHERNMCRLQVGFISLRRWFHVIFIDQFHVVLM